MTANAARTWLVIASLSIVLVAFLFFFLAPELGYPLERPDATRMVQIIVPVFAAYLGSATRFLFSPDVALRQLDEHRRSLLGLLVRGPVIVFGIAWVALIVAFGISHASYAPAGQGMSVDDLASSTVLILSLLALTTNGIVAYLFEGRAPEPGAD